MLKRPASQIIALPKRAIFVDQMLRHDKQRYTFDAFWCIWRTGEHHMHDVVGKIVFAIRDVNLLARYTVSIIFFNGFGANAR